MRYDIYLFRQGLKETYLNYFKYCHNCLEEVRNGIITGYRAKDLITDELNYKMNNLPKLRHKSKAQYDLETNTKILMCQTAIATLKLINEVPDHEHQPR